ncbi:zinc finger protein 318 isoform X2 [Sander lucioperca]|uniref:zinc finger protein 318 isoform X2 n=1 Tax=Sander lucioperca TaxID=283035 RepID=UPI00125D2C8B|nr:zinc finger protein 318 isoform X2 [Sander lucioperca]
MYRGRPPPRGGYPPPFEGRGPRPHPAPGYREDRNRPRPPYHPGYHDHGPPPDPYRRSPPRRRYPSPGSGSHRGGEFWAGGPQRERSPSPRGLAPIDHNLVITVGNELTGPSGSAPSRHHDRDYPPRPEYERSRSRGRSRPQSRSPDRSRAKSLGRSKSQVRSKSRPRSHSRSPDRSRAKSRPRSQSRSPDRSRAKSRGRSKSRSPDRSRAKSRGRSKSRSPDRSRAKSRGRSKSRSPDRSRAKSRGRSKSRPRSRSRSRSRSRGRSYSRAASRGRSKSRPRSRSSSSSSTLSSGNESDRENPPKEFRELQTARRRKELEEMLSQPTKSILKRRNDSEDSPSLRSCESPRGPDGAGLSRVAEQLLQAVKGMEPHAVASMLSELRADPQMAHRAGLDAEIKEILHLLGPAAAERPADDIDDEEKFLYGDADEPKAAPAPEPVRLDLYGDVTEDALYADYPPQMYGLTPGAAPHLQAPPTMAEVDVRYAGRPSASPDQSLALPLAGVCVPPGTEPLAAGERQALEEYEKIQDLLKTIGLDLGVSEISKMAARTKERLHGNKPPPKTPTRRRRYSSGSSEGARRRKRLSHSGSSSSSSSRSRSWSSEDGPAGGRHTKSSAPPKSHKEANSEQSAAVAPQPPHKEPLAHTPNANMLPPHPGVPIPTYPPSQGHPGMLAPSFPPPGYGQYGNYLPYMHQQWPPMYPPPSITLPPHSPEDFPYKHPYNKMASAEPSAKGLGKTFAPDGEKGKTSSGHDRRVSEEQNNESQKQKVLEEREKLKQERDVRMKKKEYLMKELERLRKQQGELLRKKRREKDGHKDPLLAEIGRLQEDVMGQISSLRREHEAAEKSRNEIEKIALILGLLPSDRPRRAAKASDEPEDEPPLAPADKKKREALTATMARSPDGRTAAAGCSTVKASSSSSSSSSSLAAAALSSARACPDKPPADAPAQAPPPEPFEYYDAGNHWCKNCNVTSGSMFDFFTHLHSKTHRKTLDPYDRPWASCPSKASKSLLLEEKLTKPAKGSEFLLPVRGFFCLLCKQFYGDAICAEEHVTTHAHNEKYKKQMYENPLYEQRRNLDRQAGLASETSGKKRKHEEEEKGSKDREEKSKHKKEKRDKKKDDDNNDAVLKEEKVKKEVEEEKPGKKEEDFRKSKSLEEERSSYSKKDEEEKYKSSKKDDKYRYSREEEERGKYRGRDEDDRYKYSRDEEYRFRFRRDDDDRYDDRAKYGPREEEYKHGKYSDFRPKYDRDRDEGKLKAEKQPLKKPEAAKPAGKPDVSKPEALPKPYEQPKIFSGPSPAMRAKLRKQSQEAGKPPAATTPTATAAAATATPTFGKFTWKKKENVLAKEAEKVAAEFIKDDEEAAKQKLLLPEDSFAKSMAVAKEIAQKLGGQQPVPPPWVSNGANRGRIRPNLPGPAAFMRKTAMLGKPAPLNTFLSMRPQNTGLLGPVPQDAPQISDGLAKALSAQNALLETKPKPPIGPPGTSEAMPPPTVPKPAPFEAKSPPSVTKPAPAVSGPAPSETKPPPAVSGPAPFAAKPPAPVCNPAPPVFKPVEAKPASLETTHSPSIAKPPQQKMVKIVSDVAAPGVPESEQTRTVFVKPPPFMNRGDGAQKSEKHKTNLAAAKAQDLFDIFYSNLSQSGASSFTKPATDAKAEGSSANKRQLPVPEAPKPQPQPQPPSQPQPQTAVCKSLQPDSPSRQTQPESDIQIASVWSLQPTETSAPDVAPSETQPTQPKLNPSAQFQADILHQNQSSTPKPESPITLAPSVPRNEPPNPKPESQIAAPTLFEVPSVPQNQSLNPKSEPQNALVQSSPQNQPSLPNSESQIAPRTNPAELEPSPQTHSQSELQAPQIKTDPQPDQDPNPHRETHPDTAPEPEPKPSPKTRGKAAPGKRTPPAARPVRQTRSQTRYQTRQQQGSLSETETETKPEPTLALGDSDSDGVSRPFGSDASSGLEEPPMMEITPETLGLPSDMTALDFDYDFNFE